MLPTIIISAILIVAFIFALRFVRKKGTCAGCAEKSHCGGGCSSTSTHTDSKDDGCSCCH